MALFGRCDADGPPFPSTDIIFLDVKVLYLSPMDSDIELSNSSASVGVFDLGGVGEDDSSLPFRPPFDSGDSM